VPLLNLLSQDFTRIPRAVLSSDLFLLLVTSFSVLLASN
jgi:hypothetical protein